MMIITPPNFIVDANVYDKIDIYAQIMNKVQTVNVSVDQNFKDTFCQYYGLNGFTDLSFQNDFFDYMEKIKRNDPLPSYRDVMEQLWKQTGRVDYSFSSKLLHTLNPDSPILDKHVLRLLGFERKDSGKPQSRINYYSDVYETVKAEYETVKAEYDQIANALKNGCTSKICNALRSLDSKYPEGRDLGLSTARKIDCLLFRLRNCRGISMLTL